MRKPVGTGRTSSLDEADGARKARSARSITRHGAPMAPAGSKPSRGLEGRVSWAVAGCPDPPGEQAIQTSAGRVARIVRANTEGWQAPDDRPLHERILERWSRS